MAATTGDPRMVRLLDADVELGAGIEQAALAEARELLVVRVREVPAGSWTPPSSDDGIVGVLLLEGLLAREVRLAGFSCTELLGAGDFLRPWEQAGTIPATVEWAALTQVHLALIDDRFLEATRQWPELGVALVARAVRRSDSLAVHFAITCLVGLEVRIHTLFWHLADRWGRVTPDGVALELPLTHESIARLARSRRPSVTTALRALAERDLVVRQDEDRWLLRGHPPANLEEIAAEQMKRVDEMADDPDRAP